MANKRYPNLSDCNSTERRINELLDDRLTLLDDLPLSEHISHCEACLKLANDFHTVLGNNLLSGSPLQPMGISGAPKLSHGLNSPSTPSVRRQTGMRQRLGVVLSLAAALMILITVNMAGNNNSQVANSAAVSTPLALTSRSAGIIDLPENATFAGAIPGLQTVHAKYNVKKPNRNLIHQIVFTRPPTIVEFAQSTPKFMNSIRLPSPTWEEISQPMDSIAPFIQFSNELPAMRSLQSSVTFTLEFLQNLLGNLETETPELGWFPDSLYFAAA